jgi:hypothetical protein
MDVERAKRVIEHMKKMAIEKPNKRPSEQELKEVAEAVAVLKRVHQLLPLS